MEPIWKETIVDCPIHGKRITKIPIFPQNTAFNTKYYAFKNTGNYYTAETEPSNTNNSSFFYKANFILLYVFHLFIIYCTNLSFSAYRMQQEATCY